MVAVPSDRISRKKTADDPEEISRSFLVSNVWGQGSCRVLRRRPQSEREPFGERHEFPVSSFLEMAVFIESSFRTGGPCHPIPLRISFQRQKKHEENQRTGGKHRNRGRPPGAAVPEVSPSFRNQCPEPSVRSVFGGGVLTGSGGVAPPLAGGGGERRKIFWISPPLPPS